MVATILQSSEGTEVDRSTFSKFLGIYSRDVNNRLLSVENKSEFRLNDTWKEIIDENSDKFSKISDGGFNEIQVSKKSLNRKSLPLDDEFENIRIIEYKNPEESQIRGVILKDFETDGSHLKKFHEWFALLIVSSTRLSDAEIPSIYDKDNLIANQVADFFVENLKNTVHNDMWDKIGREYFISRASYFTSRNRKIEAVLPAFPCKSSNTQKVVGTFPDKGEELALRRLIYVCKEIKKIYAPGLKVFIVSDGHVFSDCIGVDDDIVDLYTEKLKYFYSKIVDDPNHEIIGFVSLKDLFFNTDTEFDEEMIADVQLCHYTQSKICEDAELSRRLLMAGCDTDAGKLRKDVVQADHPRLHLYRGFTRFMLEDLSLHSCSKGISKKAFKKIVSKVAFEMIKRNDAYSNLVELLFPHHMRLSIHAHINSGPKFGIRLISGKECKIVKALDCDVEPEFEDLLHIPTPWHNCIIKIEGDHLYYLSKSKIVSDALENGHYTGEWVETDMEKGNGGHYAIKRS